MSMDHQGEDVAGVVYSDDALVLLNNPLVGHDLALVQLEEGAGLAHVDRPGNNGDPRAGAPKLQPQSVRERPNFFSSGGRHLLATDQASRVSRASSELFVWTARRAKKVACVCVCLD